MLLKNNNLVPLLLHLLRLSHSYHLYKGSRHLCRSLSVKNSYDLNDFND